MDVSSKLTVFFEEPFWVGVYERVSGEQLEAARMVFGAEPKDYEVYAFFLKNYSRLRLSPPVARGRETEKPVNPKRMQRAIQRQLSAPGAGTKAQQALKLQQEEGAVRRKIRSRELREAEEERKFELRQQKRKEKHKGR